MSEAQQFFSDLTSTSEFVPRLGQEGWSAFHAWLATVGDVATAAACFMLYAILRRVRKDRPDLVPGVFFLFASLTLLFAVLASLVDSLSISWPTYRFVTTLKLLQAGMAGMSIVALMPQVPAIIGMRSRKDYDELDAKLRRMERDNRHTVKDLQQQLIYRGVLEREVSIMRALNFNKSHEEVQKVVETLDGICDELKSLMPERYREAPHPRSHHSFNLDGEDAEASDVAGEVWPTAEPSPGEDHRPQI